MSHILFVVCSVSTWAHVVCIGTKLTLGTKLTVAGGGLLLETPLQFMDTESKLDKAAASEKAAKEEGKKKAAKEAAKKESSKEAAALSVVVGGRDNSSCPLQPADERPEAKEAAAKEEAAADVGDDEVRKAIAAVLGVCLLLMTWTWSMSENCFSTKPG